MREEVADPNAEAGDGTGFRRLIKSSTKKSKPILVRGTVVLVISDCLV